ncbi:hypothetical protein CR513_40387, partial [Mucuna pruriens]
MLTISFRDNINVLTLNWTTEVIVDVFFCLELYHESPMILSIFNCFSHLKLLVIAKMCFAYIILMLKGFKLLKGCLRSMVIGEEWIFYLGDDVSKAQVMKDFILNDI